MYQEILLQQTALKTELGQVCMLLLLFWLIYKAGVIEGRSEGYTECLKDNKIRPYNDQTKITSI